MLQNKSFQELSDQHPNLAIGQNTNLLQRIDSVSSLPSCAVALIENNPLIFVYAAMIHATKNLENHHFALYPTRKSTDAQSPSVLSRVPFDFARLCCFVFSTSISLFLLCRSTRDVCSIFCQRW